MSQIPNLSEFYKAANDGRIMMNIDQSERLVCFKYTEETAAKADWDDVTLNARGIVFEIATGKIVARPWSKFFNYHELYGESELAEKTRIALETAGLPLGMSGVPNMLDKIDGSLAIAYCYDGEWYVNTSGNFTSAQALYATRWLRDHMLDSSVDYAHTYLFELTWHLDQHPIKYERDELVFLGMIDTESGKEELDLNLLKNVAESVFGTHIPEMFAFNTLGEVAEICKSLPSNKEGFVLTWPNGFKLKMKGTAYLTLLSYYDKCTEKYLWRSYDPVLNIFHANLDEQHNYRYVDDEPLKIPEELVDIKKRMDEYVSEYNWNYFLVCTHGKEVMQRFDNMKDMAKYINDNFVPDFRAPIMSYVRNDSKERVKHMVNKCIMKPEVGASNKNPYIGYHKE